VGQFFAANLLDWPCLLAFLGILLSYLMYVRMPAIPAFLAWRFSWVHAFLVNKYYIDVTYDALCTFGARIVGLVFYRVGDIFLIDRACVEGPGKTFVALGRLFRKWQTGFLYHYAFAMVLGLLVMLVLIRLHG
jgi:NADH-quinone oxidoreductase subunit L